MSMLGRLKKAIKKVAFLLSFDATSWVAKYGKNRKRRRRISFRGHPGLLDIVIEPDSPDTVYHDAVSISRTCSGISRSTSNLSQSIGPSRSLSLDDVDRRAEEFIASFRQHLLRESSLNLSYYRRQDSSPVRVN